MYRFAVPVKGPLSGESTATIATRVLTLLGGSWIHGSMAFIQVFDY